jgi:hypothetical protein
MNMNIQLLTTYNAQLAAITAAIVNNAAASAEASTASKDRKDSLATSIRAYARDTAADEVSADEAGAALRLVLGAAEVKAGTIKGYGASFRGFRAMLEAGVDISEKNTKEAQDFVASDEVKALKAAKDRVKAATAEYKLADWLALADALEATKAQAEADATPTEAEATDVTREAQAA